MKKKKEQKIRIVEKEDSKRRKLKMTKHKKLQKVEK